MTESGSVKALVFDVFGTVVDWRTSIAKEAQRILPPAIDAQQAASIDWVEFAVQWRNRYDPSMEKIRSGERGFTRLDVLHRENLLDVFKQFLITPPSDAVIDDLNRAWHRLRPWSDVVEGLNQLKSRYIIGTLSNGNISLMVNLAKHAQLPWDVILGAEVTQHYKPSPQSYIRTVQALDLPANEVMLVAAHNKDLVAAMATGMRTGFVARPTEHGPQQSADLQAEHEFDVVAESFVDLARHLGCHPA